MPSIYEAPSIAERRIADALSALPREIPPDEVAEMVVGVLHRALGGDPQAFRVIESAVSRRKAATSPPPPPAEPPSSAWDDFYRGRNPRRG